jgi:hypothetical protein
MHQNTKVTARKSGVHAALPNKLMLVSMFANKAINKVIKTNKGLAGNKSCWPRGMIIYDLL